MSKKTFLLSLLGAVALVICCLPATAAEGLPASAVAVPATPAAEPPAGCAAPLDLLAGAPAPICAVAIDLVDPAPAPLAVRKTCRCSCGFPCQTNADCGGALCHAGITCC